MLHHLSSPMQMPQHSETIEVVSRAPVAMKLAIPRGDVHYVPNTKDARTGAKKLILCKAYDPCGPNDAMHGCRFAATGDCHFVHADCSRAMSRIIVHVNVPVATLADCPYERHVAGKVFSVCLPKTGRRAPEVVTQVPSEMCMKTRCVLDDKQRAVFHCAHFYYGRECHQGLNCDFAHVVKIGEATPKPKKPSRRVVDSGVLMPRWSPSCSISPGGGDAAFNASMTSLPEAALDLGLAANLSGLHLADRDPKEVSADAHYAASGSASNRHSSDEAATPPSQVLSVSQAPKRRWRHDPYCLSASQHSVSLSTSQRSMQHGI